MEALLEPLKELAEIEEIQEEKRRDAGLIQIAGCVGSQKTHLTYALGNGCKYKLIVTSGESKAKQMYEEYRFLNETVYLYPAKDLLFYHADLRGKQLVSSRMETIQALLLGEECTVITTFDAFMDSLFPIEKIRERVFSLKAGDTVDFEKIQKDLTLLGY
ncbi:transcription-repair coupling factor, partial [gut metagenome]